jgi:NAD(P)-dependent dehydrogenase (short-subunit alcohol dehydrogenase family)
VFRSDLLKDRVIVVTGGGTGLGKSMATRFAELGARLVLTSRSLDHLNGAAEEIRGKVAGAKVHVVACDVRAPDQVDAMVQSAVGAFGRLDVLVNNAAGNFLAQTEKLSPNGFSTVVDIVLKGTFHCTLAAGKQMIEQGGGNILSIVTPYAWMGSAYVVPSACAKAGVLTMMKSLAVEWARFKIRCNAIAPGPFPTEGAWSRLVPPGVGDLESGIMTRKIPAGRFGEHHELANLAAYLVADESGYMTGECVTIDGGESLMGGEFNGFTAFDQTALGQMFDAMKPKKPR